MKAKIVLILLIGLITALVCTAAYNAVTYKPITFKEITVTSDTTQIFDIPYCPTDGAVWLFPANGDDFPEPSHVGCTTAGSPYAVWDSAPTSPTTATATGKFVYQVGSQYN